MGQQILFSKLLQVSSFSALTHLKPVSNDKWTFWVVPNFPSPSISRTCIPIGLAHWSLAVNSSLSWKGYRPKVLTLYDKSISLMKLLKTFYIGQPNLEGQLVDLYFANHSNPRFCNFQRSTKWLGLKCVYKFFYRKRPQNQLWNQS